MRRALFPIVYLALAVSLSFGSGNTPGPRRIEIVAQRYKYTPSEITLTKGQPVTLVFTSKDVTHGFSLPELGIKAEIPKGDPTEITLTPNQAGTFEAHCATFCGPGHGNMKMTVHVEE